MYVGGLPSTVTVDGLKEYAGRDVTYVRWLNHQNGEFKGAAFVDFKSKQGAKKFIAKHGKEYEGSKLKIKEASLSPEKKKPGLRRFTIHVAGFPEADEDLLKEFIGEDVKVGKIKFLTNGSDEFNGVAFVNFKSANDADAFMEKDGDECDGNVISLNFSKLNYPSAYVKKEGHTFTKTAVKKLVGNDDAVDAVRTFDGQDFCFVDFNSIAACNAFLAKDGKKGFKVSLSTSNNDSSKDDSVFIGGLPDMRKKGTGKKLRDFMGKYGEIKYLKIISDGGYAFCTYSSVEEAEDCKSNTGAKFLGQNLQFKSRQTRRAPKQRKQSAGSL